jgi:N-acetylneuraminic acid mutarotase
MVTSVPAKPSFPSPRVGSAATTLGGKVYLFSGRGGISMAPIEENGSLLVFDPKASDWSVLSPIDTKALCPEARSYHCLTSDGNNTIYVHAGCPAKGRLSDLWSFQVSKRLWTKLTSAPDPPRGGTSIAFTKGLLFRVHGFDGTTEQGGSLDIYDPYTDRWSMVQYTPDGKSGPIPSSVSCLLPIMVKGRASLVTLFGKLDPSALGHEGAGKMSDYIWKYDIEDKKWSQVRADAGEMPAPRGWFAADAIGEGRVVVHGGLDEDNGRLGDVWIIDFSP